jgi:hypothetical protein
MEATDDQRLRDREGLKETMRGHLVQRYEGAGAFRARNKPRGCVVAIDMARRGRRLMGAFWIQFAGTISGFVGTVVLAYAYHAPSPGIHEVAGQPIATRAISGRAWYGGLGLVALGFILQAAGMLCGVFQ